MEQLVGGVQDGWEGETVHVKTGRTSGRSHGCSSPLQVCVSVCVCAQGLFVNARMAPGSPGVGELQKEKRAFPLLTVKPLHRFVFRALHPPRPNPPTGPSLPAPGYNGTPHLDNKATQTEPRPISRGQPPALPSRLPVPRGQFSALSRLVLIPRSQSFCRFIPVPVT